MKKRELVKKYLDEYPNLPSLTISKKIYSENKLLFSDIEAIRTHIRYLRGAHGKKELKKLNTSKYLSQEKLQEKYNLPPSINQEYIPYKIITNKALIFADVHIPFHSQDAISTMFDFCIKKQIDSIIINGDLIDCFSISRFDKEPNLVRFKDERQYTKDFLVELKRIFPSAKIYYKFGNHEKRLEDYLFSKAPEIYDCEEFRLEILLDLFNLGIKYIQEDKYINVNNDLKIIHGHEYKNAITSPANSARTTFLRTKDTVLSAHNHQTSNHTEQKIDGTILSCWSIGCLCNLNPKWMPLNKWNYGFAIFTKDDEKFWHINNHMIIKGRVV